MPLEIIGMFVPITVLFVVFYWINRQKSANLLKLLERYAARRGGMIIPSNSFDFPSLEFTHQDFKVSVCPFPSRRHATSGTQIESEIPTGARLISVSPRALVSITGQLAKGKELQIGSPGFDGAFRTRSDDETFVREILSSELQEKFLRLAPFGPSLCLEGGTLTLTLNTIFTDAPTLDAWVRVYLAVLDQIKAQPPQQGQWAQPASAGYPAP